MDGRSSTLLVTSWVTSSSSNLGAAKETKSVRKDGGYYRHRLWGRKGGMIDEGRVCKFESQYARCLRQSIIFQFLVECATVHWLYPVASPMSNHESISVSLAGRLYRRFRVLFSMSVRVHPWELMNDVFKDYLLMFAFATTEMERWRFGGSARNEWHFPSVNRSDGSWRSLLSWTDFTGLDLRHLHGWQAGL